MILLGEISQDVIILHNSKDHLLKDMEDYRPWEKCGSR